MALIFRHKRLHVGFRQRDWSDVWYQPVGHDDEDGGARIGLYKLTIGDPTYREPMDGEVLWHPEFDWRNCESTTPSEKKKIQQEFLNDAWKYLAEEDADEVKRMDEEFQRQDWVRWDKWFQRARKYKRTQLKAREGRRRRRKTIAQEAGLTDADIREHVNSDTSEDDSAYDSGVEQTSRKRTASFSPDRPMPPPKRPERRHGNNNNTSKNGNSNGKKQNLRTTPGGRPSVLRLLNPRMSGALSERGTQRNTESDITMNDVSRGKDESMFVHGSDSGEDEIMDTTDPTRLQTPLTAPRAEWDFAGVGSNNGFRTRGRRVGTESLQGAGPGRDPRLEQLEREQRVRFGNEDEALDAAMRASQAPEEPNVDGEALGLLSAAAGQRCERQ